VTPLGELARRFKRNQAVISRVVAAALRAGVVQFRVVHPENCPPRRCLDLQAELLRKYPDLLSATVASVGPSPTVAPDHEAALEYSDRVHRLLGLTLAIEIARGTLIKNGDQVGIGPGRGVYETIRALRHQGAVRAGGVTLISLSGVGYLRHYSKNRNPLLDPDFMVGSMGEAFEKPVALDLVSAPLVIQPGEARAAPVRRWLGSDNRNRRAIDTAIMGVGALIPGNRFYAEGSSSQAATHEPLYNSIRESLRSLLRLSESFRTPDYTPVGDIGYHLFFVPPPLGAHVPEVSQAVINRQVDSVNASLLAAHADDLKAIRSVVLVAGTTAKARALNHLITGRLVSVTHLCTDSLTAQLMLSL
jgi:DNA-binding transcriptional regulator LsrR (DeoR family)